MLIGIEASRANKPHKTGVEWYAWHVIQELKRLTPGDKNSWILYTNAILQGGLEALPENWYEVRAKWPFPFGWTQFRLSWEMMHRPTDVLFLPGSTMPRIVPKKTVVTIHDMGFHHLPKLYKQRQVHIHETAVREAVKKAARIITVSEFTGRDLVESYGADPSRIAITPLGVDHSIYRPVTDAAVIDECLTRHHLSRPFFVTVGRIEAKKNIVMLIKAFTEFKSRRGIGDPHKLVLIGIPGFGYDDVKRVIATSAVKSDIVELGYVSESDKPILLSAASALIHPSKYEGFGIPLVEAMACGCPVISSNAASLPEVAGEGNALLFSPDDVEALISQMQQVVSDESVAARLRAAGPARATGFTWEQTAKLTLPVLTAW